MNTVQAFALVLVAVAGGAVALTRDPLRQTLVLGVYGVSLAFLFMAVQAPDVALSEVVVSGIGLPVIILAALRRIREQEKGEEEGEGET